MDEVRRFIILIIGAAGIICLSVLVMVYGWGLDPKSWWWIIGVGVGGRLFGEILTKILAKKEE